MSGQQTVATVAAASAARTVAKKQVFRDSEDLPSGISVSQKDLRKNDISRVSTNIIVKKCFEELSDIIEKKDGEFGTFLKLRPIRQILPNC